MSAATVLAMRDEISGQWSGYWLEPGSTTPQIRPKSRPTGAILRRLGEVNLNEFVCLDLVLVETVAVWDGRDAPRVYEAAYADSLSQSEIAKLYGVEPTERARPDRPIVQLRLRAAAT
jgi:hypothetical protein